WEKWGRSERLFGFTDEEAKKWFLTDLTSKNVNADYFKGKTVLEVGCGHGRFVKILNDLCDEYVALDLGSGVDLAHEITQDRSKVHIIQANAMLPPLKEEQFDYVWSHGVLHHTPSTKDAFRAISRLPKHGSGRIYIWVYHKGGFLWEYGNRLVRSITTRLPSSVMHVIAYSLVPLLYLIPAYNKDVNLSNMSWAECALSTHDWLSPKYQWHHSTEEVFSWYEEQGFKDIEQTSANGVGVTGVRK
ncbi:MAG: class I SAM-dependent methyltransferase, partial [Thermodesulfovibrionia bacterium]|nr:class I SAM-dependent methyltransferase [Thermodesulfovibrionia bacterium]